MGSTEPGRPHSIGEIASGLAGDVQDLVRGELALARAELNHKLHGLMLAAVSVIGGALLAFAGLVVVLEGGAALLAFWIPAWVALLSVGGLIVLIGGLVARSAMAKLSVTTLSPDRTVASFQKDARMVKEHT